MPASKPPVVVACLALVCALVFWTSAPAWAQGAVNYASLVGDVADKTGAALPGATVSVVNKATNLSRTVTTDANGHFAVLQVPPGTYSVSVEQKSFQKAAIEDVQLDIGATRTLKITLNVGQTTETIEVSAEAATVQTGQSEVSDIIQTEQLRDLPLNQRSFTALVTQQPGLVQITSTAAPSVLSAAGTVPRLACRSSGSRSM